MARMLWVASRLMPSSQCSPVQRTTWSPPCFGALRRATRREQDDEEDNVDADEVGEQPPLVVHQAVDQSVEVHRALRGGRQRPGRAAGWVQKGDPVRVRDDALR